MGNFEGNFEGNDLDPKLQLMNLSEELNKMKDPNKLKGYSQVVDKNYKVAGISDKLKSLKEDVPGEPYRAGTRGLI